jgi:TonB-linked SusC/RagA family outer membrane protein
LKFLLTVKLIASLLLALSLQMSARTYGQETRVSVKVEKASFREMARTLKAKTGYAFLYRDRQVEAIAPFTMSCQDMALEELLEAYLEGSGLTFRVVDRTIVIVPRGETAQQQQPARVSGRVLDAKGNPVAGATVVLKGSTIGAATGTDGTFELSFPPVKDAVLVFSFIGMKGKELAAVEGKPMVVTLEEEVTEIGDVVVTGIFVKARESYTGAVTTISARELKESGNRSILSSIRNIDPSFNIIDDIVSGSDPNNLPDITMRGRTSMDMNVRDLQEDNSVQSTANLPLFVLDGFEVSLQRVMDMDQELVESITLLKDASATATYGSRGANGIVVITSRRPLPGRLRVSYRGGVNVEAPDFSSYNLMSAREKLEYEEKAGLYNSTMNMSNQTLKELYDRRKIEVERGVNTYWLKYPVHAGVGQRHSLRVDGGAQDFNYAAGVSYNYISGIMKESARQTFAANLFFQYQVGRLRLQDDLTIGHNKHDNSPYGAFSEYTAASPIYTPYDDDGFLKKILHADLVESVSNNSTFNPGVVGNPLFNATLPYRDDGSYLDVQNNFAVEWDILPGLSLRGRFGINRQDNRTDRYLSRNHTSFETDYYSGENYKLRGSYTYATGYFFSYEGDATLNYSRTLAGKHQLYAGVNYNFAEDETETYSVSGQGFAAVNKANLGMAGAYAQGTPVSSEQHSRRLGATLNLNYTYDRRYFADFSGKIEGSSKFGSNDRVAPFWSAGLGWNLHHERFLAGSDAVKSLRLRLSYGTTGSQNFSSYQALTTYRYFGQESYKFWTGAYMIGLGNPDLSWQKTRQTNVGVEAALFNGRVRLNADYYSKLTDALLTDINLPTAGGFRSYKANIGEVRNRGVEVDANVLIVRNAARGITWSVGGNLVHNANKILKVSNALEHLNSELMEYTGGDPSFLYEEGQSMNTIFVVKSLGIDPATGREVFLDKEGTRTYTWDASDKVPCGVNEPAVWGNLRTMLRWEGVSMNVVFSYRAGGYIYNQTLVDKVENISAWRTGYSPWGNLDRRALHDRWQQAGDHTYFKDIRDFNETYASSRFVMKENTLRLNSINLNYDFDTEWLRRTLKMEYLMVGLYAEDVFSISTVKQERGLSYPFARKFSVSVSTRF